jgi:hypothetical protein
MFHSTVFFFLAARANFPGENTTAIIRAEMLAHSQNAKGRNSAEYLYSYRRGKLRSYTGYLL